MSPSIRARPHAKRHRPGEHANAQIIVAVGRSNLIIIRHLLFDPDARYSDLGSTFYAKRINPERREQTHIHQVEPLGYKVTGEPSA